MKSLRLSPTHGVNPSVMQCFYCLQDKGIALLGAIPGGAEAPRQAVFDREPCETCAEHMRQGVILISVDEAKSKGDMQNPYRTGGWCVIRDSAIKRGIHPKELADHILKMRVAFVPDDAWTKMGLPRVDAGDKN